MTFFNEILSDIFGGRCINCEKRTYREELIGYEPKREWVWICFNCSDKIKEEIRKSHRTRRIDGWGKWTIEHGPPGWR